MHQPTFASKSKSKTTELRFFGNKTATTPNLESETSNPKPLGVLVLPIPPSTRAPESKSSSLNTDFFAAKTSATSSFRTKSPNPRLPVDPETQKLLQEVVELVDKAYPPSHVKTFKARQEILNTLRPYQDRQRHLTSADSAGLIELRFALKSTQEGGLRVRA
ncbi:MAG: hypothetical protein H0U75_10430 [Legionella sp.]|nr:hypothetical protein [Legionella sp.]